MLARPTGVVEWMNGLIFPYRQRTETTEAWGANLRVRAVSPFGVAVDINTLYNPYHKRLKNGKEVVEPATARPYLDRSKNHAYMIKKGDLCYRLFKAKGFRWGGDWKRSKDYQHFEK